MIVLLILLLILPVILLVLLLVPAISWAQALTIKQSTCTATWTAPQTNTDGTNLNDLKEYRVYYGISVIALAASTVPVATVLAPELDPPAGKTGTWPCKTLPLGTGFMAVTAADTAGNESAKSGAFGPFVLADDVSPQAPSGLTLGP